MDAKGNYRNQFIYVYIEMDNATTVRYLNNGITSEWHNCTNHKKKEQHP